MKKNLKHVLLKFEFPKVLILSKIKYSSYKIVSLPFATIYFISVLMLLTSCGYYSVSVTPNGNNSSNTEQNNPNLADPNNPDPESNLVADNKVAVADFVSGNLSLQSTSLKNYKVVATNNSYTTNSIINKTPKGYTIYSTSLGTLISTQRGTNAK